MQKNIENQLLSATKVTQELDISSRTLDNWYKFYHSSENKPDDMPQLPDYIQKYPRGPRYWKPTDIPKLQAFKEWIPRGRSGVMGRINERYWLPQYRKQDSTVS